MKTDEHHFHMDEEFSVSDFKLKWMKLDEFRPI